MSTHGRVSWPWPFGQALAGLDFLACPSQVPMQHHLFTAAMLELVECLTTLHRPGRSAADPDLSVHSSVSSGISAGSMPADQSIHRGGLMVFYSTSGVFIVLDFNGVMYCNCIFCCCG